MQSAINALSFIFQDTLLLFLLVGSLWALLVGLLFLLTPATAGKLNRYLNQWISLRRSMKGMESSHYMEHFLYHHHQGFGLFIILSSSYVLYQFAFHYEQQQMLLAVKKYIAYQWLADWLLTALAWFSLPAMLLAILIGALFAIRPSSLKGLEGWGNRWVSTRKWMLPLEKPHYTIDQWVNTHPRTFGGITTAIAAYLSVIFLLLFTK